MIKFVVILSVCFSFCKSLAQEKSINASSVVAFVLDHQKENGAFGPKNKEYTDLAWNYPAIHTLKILGANVPREKEAFKNGHTSWIEINSRKNGPWYWSFYQKAQLYKVLNVPYVNFEEGIQPNKNWEIQFKSRKKYLEFRDYKDGLFFDVSTLWYMVGAIRLLDGNVSNKEYVTNYLNARQAENGGFVDDVTANPLPTNSKANLITTGHAVLTLKSIDVEIMNAKKCIQWLQSCQTKQGGFKYNPDSKEQSNHADIWYTWMAIKTLKALNAKPKNVQKCIEWINSLQNDDGGFGDMPQWNSRIYSTYYAVSALDELTGDATFNITPKSRRSKQEIIPEGKYSIYQSHHKSPEGGKSMIDSVAAMNLNLIGVKSNIKKIDLDKGMSLQVAHNRAYVKQKGIEIEVLELPENYNHKLIWPNRQKADHVSNFIIPPDLNPQEVNIYKNVLKAGQKGLSWKRFKEEVIRPMMNLKSGTLFYPELDYSMLNAYRVYDEGLDGGNGYNAVTGAHFGNIDWVRHFPYKERWEGVLPIVADGDAHGNIVKWHKNLLQFRNVYISRSYHFKDYVEASLNNRSVCVIRMPSGAVRYYGSKAAVAYLKKHQTEWKWWKAN